MKNKVFQGAYSQRYSNYLSTTPSKERDDSVIAQPIDNPVCTVKVAFDKDMGKVNGTGLANGVVSVHSGDSITLTATAKSGYHFVKWIGLKATGKDTDNTLTFNVLSDCEITAIFAADETGGGSVDDPEPPVNLPQSEKGIVTLLKKYWWVLAIMLGCYLYKEGKL